MIPMMDEFNKQVGLKFGDFTMGISFRIDLKLRKETAEAEQKISQDYMNNCDDPKFLKQERQRIIELRDRFTKTFKKYINYFSK